MDSGIDCEHIITKKFCERIKNGVLYSRGACNYKLLLLLRKINCFVVKALIEFLIKNQ